MRSAAGRFLPGIGSGQAGPGRPKGLQARCRELTNDGEDLAEIAGRFLRGEIPGQSARDRLEAMRFLADRAYGKAPETILQANVNVGPSAITELSKQDLEALARSVAPALLPSAATSAALEHATADNLAESLDN